MINKLESAIALAEAETGVRGGDRSIPLCFSETKKRNRIWSENEEKFLRDNHIRLHDSEIAKHLGRTAIGVHIHKEREMHLESMSKHSGVLSAEQVANGLGVDSKTVHLLMDSGRMPCRRLPPLRIIRLIDRIALVKWMLDPENWLYFKPARVGTFFRKGKRSYGQGYDFSFWENARMLMLKSRRKWKDQWLTPGQVVKFLKIRPKATSRRKLNDRIPGVRYVNVAIRKGTIKAKRWGNWWIKKSDLPAKGKTINFRGEIRDFSYNVITRKGKEYGRDKKRVRSKGRIRCDHGEGLKRQGVCVICRSSQ